MVEKMVSVVGDIERSPVIYPSQWSWLNTFQHRGRWKSHPAPWTLCCPIQPGAQCEMATVPWNSCQGDAYRDFWLKETAFGVSVGAELRVPPYDKRTKCPFLEKHLRTFHMPSYSLHPGWRMLSRAHGSYGLTISGNPGICRSQTSQARWVCEASSYIGIFYHAMLQLVLGRPLPTH